MKTGCISDRVGVGLERIGRDAAAALRKGVVAFGFGLEGPEAEANVRRRRDDEFGDECDARTKLDLAVGNWIRA